MIYVVFAILGFIGGGISVFLALEGRRRSVDSQKRRQDEQEARLRNARSDFERQAAQWIADQNARLQAAQSQFQAQSTQWTADQESRLQAAWAELRI